MMLRTKPFCDVCKREVDSLEEVEHFGKMRLIARCHGERETIDFSSSDYVIDVRGTAFREPRRLPEPAHVRPKAYMRPDGRITLDPDAGPCIGEVLASENEIAFLSLSHPLQDFLFDDPRTAAARRYAEGWQRIFGRR